MFSDKVLEFIRLNPKKANPTTCREYLQLKLSLSGEANGLMHLYLAAAIQLTFCQDEKASTESDISVEEKKGLHRYRRSILDQGPKDAGATSGDASTLAKPL